MPIPPKVSERLAVALKRFQPIISSARARDVNESDTVTIVTDLLAELFGYDKYTEITKEYAIRGTYCDLAIQLDGRAQLLIEVKAIGLDLKDPHVKQVVDYAANKGVEWVVLTNGITWRIYRVIFAKPIDHEVITEINLLDIAPKNVSQLEQLYLIAREAWAKSTLSMYYTQLQATNKFTLAAVLLTEPVLDVMRRELRRYNPEVRVQPEEIREVLLKDVLKREVVEGEKAEEAVKKIEKIGRAALRQATVKEKVAAIPVTPEPSTEIVARTTPEFESTVEINKSTLS